MNRRASIAALAALAAAGAGAQSTRIPRIVFVSNRDAAGAIPFTQRFMAGMEKLGYVENRNFVFDIRYANNDQAQIAPVVKAAVASRPDILIVTGLYAARQARDATVGSPIPVLVATGSDLVDAGIVGSYAHPGGNITGVSDLTDDSSVKRLELLREALPKATRVGLVTNPDFPATPKIEKAVGAAAKRLGVTLVPAIANDKGTLLAAIDSLAKERVDALFLGGDNNSVSHAEEAIARANALRIPVAYFWPGTAEMGALFSYQADVFGNFERIAWYADRILKGTKPGDLAIELPKRFELVVNRKAASALGISLPNAFVLRADRVID